MRQKGVRQKEQQGERSPSDLEAASYDYELPESAIAQSPIEARDDARLLVALDPTGPIGDRRVRDLPAILRPGDVVVVNDTRVLPARLLLEKATGGRVEVLLLEPDRIGPAASRWRALVRPSRRVPPGTILLAAGKEVLRVGEGEGDGQRWIEVIDPEALAGIGRVALPPYVRHPLEDPERYQTVYARRPASVAAPTAGLHFTAELIERCRSVGVEVRTVELVVGLDTFRPMSTDKVDDHRMHSEWYDVPVETIEACRRASRVVASAPRPCGPSSRPRPPARPPGAPTSSSGPATSSSSSTSS
ncbi:MAG TPA: S-adenosylmethionine:tRNA ribosyltransferase-isomerase [Acidimicrobiales bacterium]|nr:S-adenosylmethionine:tRNA ribosyltransferase-isomerase [Acidimicrobiales bacterium]